MAGVLDQRLFAGFEAGSCLLIRRKPYEERVLRMATLPLPNRHFGRVPYMDPLGAWPAGTRVTRSIPVRMTLPERFYERLEPKFLRTGPISDIAEFVLLPHPDGQW